MAVALHRLTRIPSRYPWKLTTAALHTSPPNPLVSSSDPHHARNQNQPNSTSLLLSISATAAALTWSLKPAKSYAFFSTTPNSTRTISDLRSSPEVKTQTPSSASSSAPDIVLYQFEVCPFCNKVRAYLDFHNIPYRVVEVDPLRKTQLAQFDASYRKVPIALVNGVQVNGSTDVINHIRDLPDSNLTPPSDLDRRWMVWVDDTFIHLIAPNIYRSASESLQTFNYIADNAKFSAWQRSTIRYAGAAAMYMIGRKLKTKYGIDDERIAIDNALKEWTDAIEERGSHFLAGEKPGVADLSVYGVLKAIETFDTFAHVRKENPDLANWFDRTKLAVGDEAITARD